MGVDFGGCAGGSDGDEYSSGETVLGTVFAKAGSLSDARSSSDGIVSGWDESSSGNWSNSRSSGI
jgi:hypothetical protein